MTHTSPTPPPAVQRIAYWVLAGLGAASFLVFGIIHIWAPNFDGRVDETEALIDAFIALIAGILGVIGIPALTRK